jgi:adenosylcobinamide kinase / adenosylcobinamide-phosphate guanylyltransferase
MRKLTFILGGARSGKSTYAERLAKEQGARVLYVATGQAFDDEMRERIARHRDERPLQWQTLEAPILTGETLRETLPHETFDVVLIDCITLLAANTLLSLPEESTQDEATNAIMIEIDSLLGVYRESAASWIVVSNEVGMGVVPPTRLGRFYRDALGRANQQLAAAADEVILMVAGLPWHLKP